MFGTQTLGTGTLGLMSDSITTASVSKAVDSLVDVAATGLSLKDSLLLKHPKTKGSIELQELMEAPLPRLIDAFIKSLINRTRDREQHLLLVFDTYENVTTEIDTWLRQIFLKNSELLNKKIRIVTAGRYRLSKASRWKEIPSCHSLIKEISLKEFSKDETKEYLETIGLSNKKILIDYISQRMDFHFI